MDNVFDKKIAFQQALLNYGFIKENNGYIFTTNIHNGDFVLRVAIQENNVSHCVIEKETGEEFLLYKLPDATGKFVCEIRLEVDEILKDIASKCFTFDAFSSEQAHKLIDYVAKKYGDKLEFLWEKFDDTAIWRRKDNRKWYAIMMRLSYKKVGKVEDKICDAVVFKIDPKNKQDIVDNNVVFEGYHMNKRSWATIFLDNSVCDSKLFDYIDQSYILAKNSK